MTFAKILPLTMVCLSVAAAGVYAVDGDWKRAGYWFCAAGITVFVTIL